MSRQFFGILAVMTLPLLSPAVSQAQPGGDHPRHAPPPAAFDACKGKKATDACEVTFGDRKMAGQCVATPDGQLACRPEPPPEMKKACEGKKEGDACSVQHGARSFEGTCHTGHGETLMCRPAHDPHQ